MATLLHLLLSIIIFCSIACSEDVKLPQGDMIAVELLQKLHVAHEVAENQKAQEDLFLSLPLVAPNQTDSVSVANTSALVSTPPKVRHRKADADAALDASHERRALECDGELWQEGQDPCEGREREPGFVACYQPCQFTLDWFVANAQTRPNVDECVFYTAGLSETAKQFVNRHNGVSPNQLTTIWHIWAENPWMRYEDRAIDNPMRCIIQSDVFQGRRNQLRQTYFERMSDAMAFMCGGNVAVMDRNIRRGRTGRVKQAGIWARQEFPRLKMDAAHSWVDGNGVNRVANRIDAIGEQNPNVADTQVWWSRWWVRGGPDWPNEATKPFKRRSVEVDANSTEDEVEVRRVVKRDFDTSIFDEGGRLAVDW